MTRLPRIASWMTLTLAAAIFVVGCHQNPATTDTSTNASQDQSQDPASANLAPASDTTTAPAPSPAPQSAPASSSSNSYAPADDNNYAPQPVASAPEPPPPLPEYDQPPAPGDGYIWTPGYWNYARTSYYWVPGVWTRAPYQGALWTPGYWGYRQTRYVLFPGHWGHHIGFYGGVNYGFGYVGTGYEGGYWRGDQFNYNRAVNNIDTTRVHNVYNFRVVERNNGIRVAFNGGSGGVQFRPRPEEMQAWREPVAPRMSIQVEHERSAQNDRSLFVEVNHGHPGNPAFNRPLEADRDVRPMSPQQFREMQQGNEGYGRPEDHDNRREGHGNPHDNGREGRGNPHDNGREGHGHPDHRPQDR